MLPDFLFSEWEFLWQSSCLFLTVIAEDKVTCQDYRQPHPEMERPAHHLRA